MNKAGGLTLKIFAMIFLNDVIDATAQILMKKGIVGGHAVSWSLHALIAFVGQNAASPLVLVGVLLYAFNFFLWIVILSKIDLSLAVPLGSTTYALIPLASDGRNGLNLLWRDFDDTGLRFSYLVLPGCGNIDLFQLDCRFDKVEFF